MPKSRREFLRLAGYGCVLPAVAALAPAAAGMQKDSTLRPAPGRLDAMPMPLDRKGFPDAELARRIKAISNVFEVGKPEPDYAYVENLGDGRGYTVTQYGFCTYNSEVTQVIRRHLEQVPDSALASFLPELPPSKWTHGDLEGFPHAWRQEIHASEHLGQACDGEADILYFAPAMESAISVGVKSPIGLSIFYDTLLQHGASTDPDSLPSILKRTLEENGDIDSTSEQEFLRAFLAERRSVLENSANHETRGVWQASARRVDALLKLLAANPNLVPPIDVANADVEAIIL